MKTNPKTVNSSKNTQYTEIETMSRLIENDKQWRIIFIKNGIRYDTEYIDYPKFQKAFAKRGLPKKPCQKKYQGFIIGVILVSKGEWFEEKHIDEEWAQGPYLQFVRDSFLLSVPISTKTGLQNGAPLGITDWYRCIQHNPLLFAKMQSWKIKHNSHLKRYHFIDEIKMRTLRAPWGYLVCAGIKNIENVANNIKLQDRQSGSESY